MFGDGKNLFFGSADGSALHGVRQPSASSKMARTFAATNSFVAGRVE